MSIIFFDGFDHYNGFGAGGRKWSQGSSTNQPMTTGRFGGQCATVSGSGSGAIPTWPGIFKAFSTNYSSLIVGAAMRHLTFESSFGPINHPFMMFADGNTIQASVWIDPATYQISIRSSRGQDPGDDIIASGSFVPPLTLWYYIEVSMTIGNPGTVVVRINGTEIISASGSTQQSGNATCNKVHFAGLGNFGPFVNIDDMYIINPNDSTNSIDFLGEVRVQTKYPDADGFQTDFLRSTGSVNANNVNVPVTNYTETGLYNYSGAVGAKDLYSIGNFTVSGTIFAVQENLSFRKDDVGSRTVGTLLRTASTEYDGGSAVCFSDYTHQGHIWEVNPNTNNPWNLTNLNQAEFGVKVTA